MRARENLVYLGQIRSGQGFDDWRVVQNDIRLIAQQWIEKVEDIAQKRTLRCRILSFGLFRRHLLMIEQVKNQFVVGQLSMVAMF